MATEVNVEMAAVQARWPHDRIWPCDGHGPVPRERVPEELLMIAILHDALDCLQKYRFATSREKRRLFCQARRWVLADDTRWPYSFERICGALDLDPSTVRRRVALRAAVPLRASLSRASLEAGAREGWS